MDINGTFMLFVAHSVCHPSTIKQYKLYCFIQQVAPSELSKQEHKSNLQDIQVSKIMLLFFRCCTDSSCKNTLVVVDEASRIYPIHRLASSPSCCDWLCVTEAAGYFPPVVYMAIGFLFLTLCCSDLALKRRTSSPTVSEDSSTPKTPLRESA